MISNSDRAEPSSVPLNEAGCVCVVPASSPPPADVSSGSGAVWLEDSEGWTAVPRMFKMPTIENTKMTTIMDTMISSAPTLFLFLAKVAPDQILFWADLKIMMKKTKNC